MIRGKNAYQSSSLLFSSLLFSACNSPESLDESLIAEKTFAASYNWTPACPWWGYTALNLGVTQWQPKDRIAVSNSYPNYAHNTRRLEPFLFSQNIEYASFHFSEFSIEDTGDQLTFNHRLGSSTFSTSNSLNGTWIPYMQTKTTGSHTGAYLEMDWRTNDSGNDIGYEIDAVATLCQPSGSPVNTTYVMRNWAYNGLLLQTNDVIYLWTTQPANQDMSLLVWPIDVNGNFTDVAMYASVNPGNTMPSHYNHDFGSDLADGTPEFILLEGQQNPRTVYIAIGSTAGAGQFRFYANAHTATREHMDVITDWPTSVPHRSMIRDNIGKIIQAQYFATDGRHLFREVDIYWDYQGSPTLQTPRIVFSGYDQAFPGQCMESPVPNDHITFNPRYWCGDHRSTDPANPPCVPISAPGCLCSHTHEYLEHWVGNVAPHEFGHCFYDLDNEEYPNPPSLTGTCGHSVMASYDFTKMNAVDYCDGINGGKNPHPGYTGHSLAANNWDVIETCFYGVPQHATNYTPDPFYKLTNNVFNLPFSSYITITEHN